MTRRRSRAAALLAATLLAVPASAVAALSDATALRLVAIDGPKPGRDLLDSGTYDYAARRLGYSVRWEGGPARSVDTLLSLKINELPTAIVPGEAFAVEAEVAKRRQYLDGYVCLPPGLGGEHARLSIQMAGITARARGEDLQARCENGRVIADGSTGAASDDPSMRRGAARLRLQFVPLRAQDEGGGRAHFYRVDVSGAGEIETQGLAPELRLFSRREGATEPPGTTIRISPLDARAVEFRYEPGVAEGSALTSLADYQHPAGLVDVASRPPSAARVDEGTVVAEARSDGTWRIIGGQVVPPSSPKRSPPPASPAGSRPATSVPRTPPGAAGRTTPSAAPVGSRPSAPAPADSRRTPPPAAPSDTRSVGPPPAAPSDTRSVVPAPAAPSDSHRTAPPEAPFEARPVTPTPASPSDSRRTSPPEAPFEPRPAVPATASPSDSRSTSTPPAPTPPGMAERPGAASEPQRAPGAVVPDLRGRTLAEARIALEAAGLEASWEDAGPAPAADRANLVAAQAPEAGASVRPGAVVSFRLFGAFLATPAEHTAAKDCSPLAGSVSVWDEAKGEAICQCPPGLSWNEQHTACASKQDAARTACTTKWPGSIPQWTSEEAYDCTCVDGFWWTADRTACRPREEVAVLTCTERWRGSTPVWKNADEYECGCPPGSWWNSDRTACTPKEDFAARDCSARWGGSVPQWTSTDAYQCGCPSGHTWNVAKTQCVPQVVAAQESCDARWPGTVAAFNRQANAYQCECGFGQTWDMGASRCVVAGAGVSGVVPDSTVQGDVDGRNETCVCRDTMTGRRYRPVPGRGCDVMESLRAYCR